MIKEIREMDPFAPEPPECSIFRQMADALLEEYETAIAICCRDDETPCFNNQSVGAIVRGYTDQACSFIQHQPDQIDIQVNSIVDVVGTRMRQTLEELLAPCFDGEIPR